MPHTEQKHLFHDLIFQEHLQMTLLVVDLIQILGLTDCFPDLASRVFGLGCSHPLGQLVLVVSLCLVHMLSVCPILCQGN
jgi:hypothetical protein